MDECAVVVIGETASLAAALVELLETEGVGVVAVRDLQEAETLAGKGPVPPHPLLISASNGHYCPTARRWPEGPLRDSELVVVGTRDPGLRSTGRLHVVPLPLVPSEFLNLVRELRSHSQSPGRAPAPLPGR
ncbi:MAG TPA: hypothetical protein VN842_02825 [Thermoplasmata archaeon]|nr:hypothetical protein [Thermoplasmata archaeon]